jgi:class I fructose-bisphosphate aldolase
MKVRLSKILTKGKAMYLAYDQGMEHGAADFNDRNVNPLFILDIAKRGKYNAVIFQKGIAEKYNKEIKKSKVPLIVKLNGKTNLLRGEPISRQLCTVQEAVKLGAVGVGYTIYIGSQYESVMLQEFSRIRRSARAKGIPVIAWIYPRGKSVKKKSKKELMAYAARVGLEIGADIVKLNYHGSVKDLRWAVSLAGKTKIVVAGGVKKGEKEFLKDVKDVMKSGAIGLAVGRNVWQHERPLEITQKIRRIVWG